MMTVKKAIPVKKRAPRESDIEGKVCRYAKSRGVLAYKFVSPAHRSVPDRMFLFPGGRALFIEFKAPGKKPTGPQEREIQNIKDYNHLVYVCDNEAYGCQLIDRFLELINQGS